ncbi:substrate-binding domain-containing protein [Acidisoma sp. S159]|uniref:ABC transporter substrate-binding protein n=1 Tax=Acidisoma sp. S159 TaxID=1747225 RepID=UPI0020B14DEB|nr:substrate-binding domain-containing protein [Acidisoma sp. S159]
MRLTETEMCGAVFLGVALLLGFSAAARADNVLSQAKAVVAAATAPASAWTGPTTGPVAATGKTVVYVAADLRNGGIQEVGDGVKQAGAKIGWTIRVLDGQGSISGIQSAFGQAMALKPNGIVIGGYDVVQNAASIQQAVDQGVKIVAWHGGPKPGAMPDEHVFTNITSDSANVAKVAADYAIAMSDGHAGVIVFTDSAYAIALSKARMMRDEVKRCTECTILSFEDTPLADTSTRMPQLTTSLLQRYGAKWTYSLAINDLYYDFMGPSLTDAGRDPAGPPVNISAGDGSISAYERIRSGQFQAATVPEPLILQGWQVIDELNRAFAGQAPSGYVAPVHLVTAKNVDQDGGKKDIYDPDNHYRDAYAKIWGK